MNISLDEQRARLRESPQGKTRVVELRGLAQEKPRMEALTGSAEWDHFNRYIEAQIKMAEAEVLVKRAAAATLVLTDEPRAKAAAVSATILESRVATLLEVIALPKWLIAQGERAAALVAELERQA